LELFGKELGDCRQLQVITGNETYVNILVKQIKKDMLLTDSQMKDFIAEATLMR
jgi:hypothetical protein